MDERKARIRRPIRAARAARRAAGTPGALVAERRALLDRWRELLDLLGLDVDSPDFVPALFVPAPSEPDVSGILAAHPRALLPVLVDASGAPLAGPAWGRRRGDVPLVAPSPHRPAQPGGPVLGPGALGEASVVLVAALAVDEGGTRLGQGGGWYDRALPSAGPGVPVVAVVFDDEVFPAGALPRESHDRRVDGVLTPARTRLFD